MMAAQRDDGGTVGSQNARAAEATSRQSASHSPAITIAPALFSSEQAAHYLGMSEAKFHELRGAEWMCAPILLGPRLIRWSREDLDHAIAAMPRQAARSGEPTQLLRGKIERLKAGAATTTGGAA